VTPLTPERYKIQFTVSRETHEKFRRAQALLRNAIPSGDAGEIFDRALTVLVEKLESKRFAETSKPRASKAAAERSRYIPSVVRRAVWSRDGGRCAFDGSAGRCCETAFLEFHHVDPYADGGEATVENIQLRCRAHNVYEARLYFGDFVVRENAMPYAVEPRPSRFSLGESARPQAVWYEARRESRRATDSAATRSGTSRSAR
jgi:hypothetical protein